MRRTFTAPAGSVVELRLADGTVVRGRRVTVRRYGRWHPRSVWLRLKRDIIRP